LFLRLQGSAMPGKPRVYMVGVQARIVQTGNDRDACFLTDDDDNEWLGLACVLNLPCRLRLSALERKTFIDRAPEHLGTAGAVAASAVEKTPSLGQDLQRDEYLW